MELPKQQGQAVPVPDSYRVIRLHPVHRTTSFRRGCAGPGGRSTGPTGRDQCRLYVGTHNENLYWCCRIVPTPASIRKSIWPVLGSMKGPAPCQLWSAGTVRGSALDQYRTSCGLYWRARVTTFVQGSTGSGLTGTVGSTASLQYRTDLGSTGHSVAHYGANTSPISVPQDILYPSIGQIPSWLCPYRIDPGPDMIQACARSVQHNPVRVTGWDQYHARCKFEQLFGLFQARHPSPF